MTVALRQFITQIINQALEKRSTNQQVKNIISPTKTHAVCTNCFQRQFID